MRTLFVGDVHGCARPLADLLRLAEADRVVLVGDIFAKGPDPRGVWDLIRDVGAEGILGNHDLKLLRVWGTDGESRHHRAARALPNAARRWVEALPLFRQGPGWIAVHAGLNPEKGVAGTSRGQALTMRRWPDDEDPRNPFWFQLWKGPETVIYGHDAVRGVQIHPKTIGLDSGCVYGRKLSGWILEEGTLLQVVGNVEDPLPI